MGCSCTKNSQGIDSKYKSSPNKIRALQSENNIKQSSQDGNLNYERIMIRPFSHKKNYLYHISPHNWLKIIDFLSYRELVETGKINRTMNYLVKNAKILMKFFKNKRYAKKRIKEAYCSIRSINSNTGSKSDGINISYITNPTILSLPSFQGNIENASINNANLGEGSSFSGGSGNGIAKKKTIKSVSGIKGKYLSTINVNSLKSVANSDQGEYNIINNTINNQTLNFYINTTPDNYIDFFTQNEVDWNVIRREMTNSDIRSIISDQTPSFSSNNLDASDTFYPKLNNYYVKNINLKPDRAKNFLTAGGHNNRTISNVMTTSQYSTSSPLKLKCNDNSGGPRSPSLGRTFVNNKPQFSKLNTIVEENKNTRWNNK